MYKIIPLGDPTQPGTNSAIIMFNDYPAGYLKACVVTVSGTTATVGTAIVLASGTANTVVSSYIDGIGLSATSAILKWNGNACCAASISGTTLSVGASAISQNLGYQDGGSQEVLKGAAHQFFFVNSTTALSISAWGSSVYAYVMTVSGTNLAIGQQCVFGTGANQSLLWDGLQNIGGGVYLLPFSAGGLGLAKFTISGTTITVTENFLYPGSGAISYFEIMSNGEYLAFIGSRAFRVGFNASGKMMLLSQSTNAGTPGSSIPVLIGGIKTWYTGAWVGYTSGGTNYAATFTISGRIQNDPTTMRNSKVLGVLQSDGTNVVMLGISSGHTGLTAGDKVYYLSDGSLRCETDTAFAGSGTYLGRAISSSEIYVDQYTQP